MNTTESTQAQSTQSTRNMGEFGGKYAKAQAQLFKDLQTMFGVEESKADKIALRFAADFGSINAKSQTEASIGKVNKKGLATLKESTVTKNAAVTFPLKIARAVQWANDSADNFISYGFTSWRLNDECQEYVDNL